jgi:Carboxypeptidase regulatory-like domain/TonB-dependent Receptor Plug Domain
MLHASRPSRLVLWLLAGTVWLRAQTTNGVIRGLVRDSVTGGLIASATFEGENSDTNTTVTATSGPQGTFGLALLPPGSYRIHVAAAKYQDVEIENLDLPVAGILEIDLELRPLSDVWERGRYRSVFLPDSRSLLVFYGPDVDTSYSGTFEPPTTSAGRLDTSVSDVVPPQLISELPLQGRDVYTALVMEPGVTSDTSTMRGIGVSVNGQRPSSSNFLLDGAENNNYLLSGPSLTLPPEAIQEFRVSTGNFSAEYGGTSGFIVNAVTVSGGSAWHGIGYNDFNNAGLNANDFQLNAQGQGSLPFIQENFGGVASGPINRVVAISAALDFLSSKGDEAPQEMLFPAPSYIAQMAAADPGSYGVRLLEEYAPPHGTPLPDGIYQIAVMHPTDTLRRLLGLTRLDITPPRSKQHLSVRLAGGWVSRPDLYWSPYPGFSTSLEDRSAGAVANLQSLPRPNLDNELRVAWNGDDFAFPLPHPQIPGLVVDSTDVPLPQGGTLIANVQVPQAGSLYGYQNYWHATELSDSLTWLHGRQVFKFGGEALLRRIGGYLGLGQDGQLTFTNLNDFLEDKPTEIVVGLDRLAFPQAQFENPQYQQRFDNRQWSFFAQDSVTMTERFSLNFGVRYDAFGAPVNTGQNTVDLVQLGAGANIAARIAGATVVPGTSNEALYSTNLKNWAGRLGFSYALDRSAKTVLRGGGGTFYDRSFDNLWENLALNNVLLEPGFLLQPGVLSSGQFSYAVPLASQLAGTIMGASNFNRLTMYQPGIRTPYTNSTFLGVQRQLVRGLTLETNYSGDFGRELITTDRVNRTDSVIQANGLLSSLNPALPEIFYRGNQGDSNYDALTVKLTGVRASTSFQIAYTWSHAIDNQSEPLNGEFDDLSETNIASSSGNTGVSAFVQQFASSSTRGNSDFDQRHNLVGMGVWRLPGRLRDWRVSALGAIRSGLPYTVYSDLGSPLYNAPANLIASDWSTNQPAPGGRLLLNAAAFQNPPAGIVGNTGRNEFPGPGFYSVDTSLSRSFHPRGLPESSALIIRVDAYNMLNHANLNDPDSVLGSPNFGVATYGRQTQAYGTPILTPLQETSRQIHLMLRFVF